MVPDRASVWVMRRKFPDVHRPYKAWLYPWSLVGILAIYFAFLVITLITAFVPSLIGLLLIGQLLIGQIGGGLLLSRWVLEIGHRDPSTTNCCRP